MTVAMLKEFCLLDRARQVDIERHIFMLRPISQGHLLHVRLYLLHITVQLGILLLLVITCSFIHYRPPSMDSAVMIFFECMISTPIHSLLTRVELAAHILMIL